MSASPIASAADAASAAPPPPLQRRRIDCGEVTLDCRLAGPEDAPLVVLLHGFPESWYSWRHQIAALAPEFRVVAPTLRGYGESDRPSAVADYGIEHLVGDVRGLIRGLGRDRAAMVAHDWGGGIAWALAMDHPELCDKLVVCNCPHPAMMTRALRRNPRQLLRSWYMFFFQIPRLPEWILSRNDFAALERGFRGMVRRRDREVFSDLDLAALKEALRPPGATTAAIDYYRAAFRNQRAMRRYDDGRQIRCPTLLIWAEEDDALGKELTYGMEPLLAGPFSIEYVAGCGHWVQQERPEEVNRALLEFLRRA
jgi:pimeloyl-ACP methyl ester carboxylesterase